MVERGVSAAPDDRRREVSADTVRTMCLDPSEDGDITVRAVRVTGKLDLSGQRLTRMLRISDCEFTEPIDLTEARAAEAIQIIRCELNGLRADRLRAADDLIMEAVHSRGTVSLVGARIGGNLACTGSALLRPGGVAFDGREMAVEGSARFDGRFRARGRVVLTAARVTGVLDLRAATCENPSIAISPQERSGDLDSAVLSGGSSGKALEAGLVEASEVLLDDGFRADGEVVFDGGTVAKRLTCNTSTFHNPGGVALNLDGLDCGGKVLLGRRFTARGQVRLIGAKVQGELNCTGGTFDGRCNEERSAIRADGLACQGSVYLNDGFKALGGVHLVAAVIGTQLNCTGGRFHRPDDAPDEEAVESIVLCADRMSCLGSVYLNAGFAATGGVSLAGATVGHDLNCAGGDLPSLHAPGLTVGSSFIWRPGRTPRGPVDVSFAQVGRLDDDLAGWPPRATSLAGFIFGSLAESRAAGERCRWLGNSGYAPDVYQQLVRFYRQSGHEDDARTMAIERQRARRRRGSVPLLSRWWSAFLDLTVGYGYKMQRVLLFVVLLWLASIYPFYLAQMHDVMQPVGSFRGSPPDAGQCTAAYPCFVPAVYSLEILFPVINLRQVAYWLPSGVTLWGKLLWGYVWFAILLGWALSIAVAGGIGHLFSQKD
jgi:hypothetical protein